MNAIVINIDPVAFHIGHLVFRWYGLAILLAVIMAVLIAVHGAKQRGIPPEKIYGLFPWLLVAGLIGARLFHIIDHWDYYAANPVQMLQFQQGGLAIWGAMLGGGAAMLVYARIERIPLGRLADILVPALLVAQIIGRLGCIVNGDAVGGVTSLPWGFVYTHPDSLVPPNLYGVPTHPYPIYEMLWNGLSLIIVLRLHRYFKRDGTIFAIYLLLYSLGRLVLSSVRQEAILLWGLQEAQLVAIIFLTVSALILIKWTKKTKQELL